MGSGVSRNFSLDDVPDLSGRVFLVTGANTGLGAETAARLLERKATVVATARPGKVAAMVEGLRAVAAEGARVEGLELDLGDLASVRGCAEKFAALGLPLHVLVNNAGVMMCPLGKTTDGFETQFGVNHLGHFLLTLKLFPALAAAATPDQPSRVVVLSSSYHSKGPKEGILFDNLTWAADKPGPTYSPGLAYGHSKFANLLFAQELHARAAAAAAGGGGGKVVAFAVHPGFVDTNLTRHLEAQHGKGCVGMFKRLGGALPVDDGALTQLFCATAPEALEPKLTSRFFVPIASESEVFKEAPAITPELRAQLWAVSEQLVGEPFAL